MENNKVASEQNMYYHTDVCNGSHQYIAVEFTSNTTVGKTTYYQCKNCGKFLSDPPPHELPISTPNVQESDTTDDASSNEFDPIIPLQVKKTITLKTEAKDKNPSNSINNSPEQWKEKVKEIIACNMVASTRNAIESDWTYDLETTANSILSFFLPIIERQAKEIERLLAIMEVVFNATLPQSATKEEAISQWNDFLERNGLASDNKTVKE